MELLIGAHDPEGRMVNQLSILEATIKLFSSTIAAVTPSSSVELGTTLQNMGVSVIEGSRSPHETELNLLRCVKSGAAFVTMDKLLHMQRNFP